MPSDPLDQLHSIRFRKPGLGSKAVLTPDQEKAFSRFLLNTLGSEVFVISTGLGLDVYYNHQQNCSEFIIKNLWLFKETDHKIPLLVVSEENHGQDVLDYFSKVVTTLVSYPLLLVSCSKKFMQHYHMAPHKSRLHILLYSAFQFHLQKLVRGTKTPYIKKIKKLLNESNALDFDKLGDNEKLANQFRKSQNLN